MISGGRNFKEIERKKLKRNRSKNEAKIEEKTELCEISQPLRNQHYAAKPFRNIVEVSARVFRSCEGVFGTRVPLRSTGALIWQLRNALQSGKAQISHQKSHSAGYFVIAKPVLAHCAISQHSDPHFAAAKRLRSSKT